MNDENWSYSDLYHCGCIYRISILHGCIPPICCKYRNLSVSWSAAWLRTHLAPSPGRTMTSLHRVKEAPHIDSLISHSDHQSFNAPPPSADGCFALPPTPLPSPRCRQRCSLANAAHFRTPGYAPSCAPPLRLPSTAVLKGGLRVLRRCFVVQTRTAAPHCHRCQQQPRQQPSCRRPRPHAHALRRTVRTAVRLSGAVRRAVAAPESVRSGEPKARGRSVWASSRSGKDGSPHYASDTTPPVRPTSLRDDAGCQRHHEPQEPFRVGQVAEPARL